MTTHHVTVGGRVLVHGPYGVDYVPQNHPVRFVGTDPCEIGLPANHLRGTMQGRGVIPLHTY